MENENVTTESTQPAWINLLSTVFVLVISMVLTAMFAKLTARWGSTAIANGIDLPADIKACFTKRAA